MTSLVDFIIMFIAFAAGAVLAQVMIHVFGLFVGAIISLTVCGLIILGCILL